MIKTAGFGKSGLHLVIEARCKKCQSDNLILISPPIQGREIVPETVPECVLKCRDCGSFTGYKVIPA